VIVRDEAADITEEEDSICDDESAPEMEDFPVAKA